MPWQPMHMATLASTALALVGAAAAAGAAGAEAAGACAWVSVVTQATPRAKSVVNNLFILRAQSQQEEVRFDQPAIISRAPAASPQCPHPRTSPYPHEVS